MPVEPAGDPTADTNSSAPETRRRRRRGGAIAGAYQPWYLRVLAPAAVPHANPPRASVSSHSRSLDFAASSAPEYASGLRISFSLVVVGFSIGCAALKFEVSPSDYFSLDEASKRARKPAFSRNR